MDLIAELEAQNKGQAVAIDEIIDKSRDLGMNKDFIERNIERIRQDGMLFQPRAGFIKRT